MLADMKGLRGMFSEIKLVTLGVADLDRSIAFYADAFGFEEISRTRVEFEALSAAWRIPAGIAGRFAVMGIPGVESGMLRLVEWTPSGDPVWSPPARFQDLGAHAVTFRVKDVNVAWDMLNRAGARDKLKPTYWEVEQNIAAWDAQGADIDGTLLGVFQVIGEIERALGPLRPGRDTTEAQTLAIHVADARHSEAFYVGLGFESLYDRVVDHLWDFYGLPQGTKVHRINLIKRGDQPAGRVELIQHIGLPGRTLKARTAAPGRGPLMMSLEVKNLEEATARMKNLGAKAIANGHYDSPPFGMVNAGTFFGPNDEVIELFQRES
jgi:catechol 2,3-dioxygenase-like lactoylglutathione lyase family enzyme